MLTVTLKPEYGQGGFCLTCQLKLMATDDGSVIFLRKSIARATSTCENGVATFNGSKAAPQAKRESAALLIAESKKQKS